MESLLDGRRGEKQGWDSQLWQSSPEEASWLFSRNRQGQALKTEELLKVKVNSETRTDNKLF